MRGFFSSHMRLLILIAAAQLVCLVSFADEPQNQRSVETPPVAVLSAKPIEKSIQELAAEVKKSVVVITFLGREGQQQGLGAGFIVSSDGLVATNLHVIGEARPIRVELQDGRKFDVAAVHATEKSQDLAVLKIDATNLPALTLGNSDDLKEGQHVVAIGNPLGLERSVVSGVLSARREIDGRQMLQIALPIERGNSGGPVLDLEGRVHGLLTLKSLKTENLGFAITVNSLKPLLEKPNPIPMNRWLTIGAMDPDEWTVPSGGRWRQRAGQISVDGQSGGFGGRALCLAKDAPPELPYEISVQVKYAPSDGAAGLVFHSDGGDKHYGFYPTNGNLRFSRFDGPDVYSWTVLREIRSPALKQNGWNHLKARIESDRIVCYLNGEMVFESSDAAFKSGRVGLCKFRQTEAEFKGFRVGKTLTETRPAADLLDRVVKTVAGLGNDDDATMAAIQKFASEQSVVVDAIEQQARELEQQASRLRRIAADVHTKQTLSELKSTLQQDNDNLLRAALLIAKLDNTELEIETYVRQIERHATRARSMYSSEAGEQQRFAALNRYLFDEQGFHGSRTDYGHRSNSYVNEALDDREGLPITLSVLYIEIARRLDLNVVGVGMPGHFLVRHEPRSGSHQLVDVFDRGRLLTPEQARTMCEEFSGLPWQESYLNAISVNSTIERMLRNLFNVAMDPPDVEQMLKYSSSLLVVNPDSAQDHLRSAVLCFQTQRWQQARSELEWLTTHETSIDHQTIEELARAIARESRK